ncbi:MAG: hypothetical protein LC792_16910 [Actinobacteria bacterium]|nr:hypothetical protein [Actinomycetota bacterium]
MRRMIRKKMAASVVLAAGALLTTAGFVMPGAAVAAGPASISDPVGDTINRDTNAKLASAMTDIVSTTVDSGAAGIVLTFKTQQLTDPATDAHWASPNTFVSWQIDSTGDGKVDDLIRFSVDRDHAGALLADLTHWSGPGQPAQHCDAQAAFDPALGYSITVAPSCMGNPTSVSYRTQLTYDTDPGAAKPPLAFDVVPDQGLAGPVAIAVPTAPAAAPPAPDGAANPAPAAGGAPAATAPAAAKPATPAAKPSPKPAAKAPTSSATRAPAAAAAPKPAAPAPAAQPAAPSGQLAATGSSARWLGALGGVLLLLGGFGLMTPAERRRQTA